MRHYRRNDDSGMGCLIIVLLAIFVCPCGNGGKINKTILDLKNKFEISKLKCLGRLKKYCYGGTIITIGYSVP